LPKPEEEEEEEEEEEDDDDDDDDDDTVTVITGEKSHLYETVELWIFLMNKHSFSIPTVKIQAVNIAWLCNCW